MIIQITELRILNFIKQAIKLTWKIFKMIIFTLTNNNSNYYILKMVGKYKKILNTKIWRA